MSIMAERRIQSLDSVRDGKDVTIQFIDLDFVQVGGSTVSRRSKVVRLSDWFDFPIQKAHRDFRDREVPLIKIFHRSDSRKARPLAVRCRLCHQAWKSVDRFDLWIWRRELHKKCPKGVNFTYVLNDSKQTGFNQFGLFRDVADVTVRSSSRLGKEFVFYGESKCVFR